VAGTAARIGINPIVTLEKTATEYASKPGIKWLSCSVKCQSDITLGALRLTVTRGELDCHGLEPGGADPAV
jgi:hypothetical protein